MSHIRRTSLHLTRYLHLTMHLTPEDLLKLEKEWLNEGWSLDAVQATVRGLQFEILATRGQEILRNSAGLERPTTPTNGNT